MGKNIVICCDGTANEFAADKTNVVKLYTALVHDQPGQCAYYQPGIGTMEPPGDRVSLFGFSRGAYTVRAVATTRETRQQSRATSPWPGSSSARCPARARCTSSACGTP